MEIRSHCEKKEILEEAILRKGTLSSYLDFRNNKNEIMLKNNYRYV